MVVIGLILGACLFAVWLGNMSQAVQEKVEEKTDNEAVGNGCGWLFFGVVCVMFMCSWPILVSALMGGG